MERTTNLSLKKPGLDDDALISDLNENFDKLDSKVGPVGNTSLQSQITAQSDNITKVQNGLAYIVGDTNTTGTPIAVGEFVYVKGHATIPDGLRKVSASIAADGNITTNNTDACPEGGLNAVTQKLTGIITPETGITISNSQLYNRNDLIVLNFKATKEEAFTKSTWNHVATIPSNYYSGPLFFTCFDDTNGKAIEARLTNSGVIDVYIDGVQNVGCKVVIINMVYFI